MRIGTSYCGLKPWRLLPEIRIKFAIVEDDVATRSALIDAVCRGGEWELVGEGATVHEGRLLIERQPDLLLVDLGLPDGSGIVLIREARRRGFCKTVVISIFGDESSVIDSIEAGAAGYLLKGSDYVNVPRALQEVMCGAAPISPAIAGHLLQRIRGSRPGVRAGIGKSKLTPREVDILGSIAKGYTYKEVAQQQGISHHTVNDHLKAIYRKLSVRSRGEAIYEAAKAGLLRLGREANRPI